MESINRVLSNSSQGDQFKEVILTLFGRIVENLNLTVMKLEVTDPANDEIEIIKQISEDQKSDEQLMAKIDLQWLFYEYRGLLKTYLRKFNVEHAEFLDDAKNLFSGIQNEPTKNDVFRWLEELQY